jgi:hypothetical protein
VIRGAVQVGEGVLQIRVVLHLAEHVAGVSQHHGELIVEVVGDAAPERAERLHLLRLHQLLLAVPQALFDALALQRGREDLTDESQQCDGLRRPRFPAIYGLEAEESDGRAAGVQRDPQERADPPPLEAAPFELRFGG